MREPRTALFISGRGSNASAVMDMMAESNVVLGVSSKANCWGVVRARRQGLPVLILDKQINWQKLHQDLCDCKISRIFLLGFMRILEASFCEKWQKRIWNLHPSLLPEFPGKNSIVDSFMAQADMGVSIHEVIAKLDAGPLIWQNKVIKKEEFKHQPGDIDLPKAQFEISRAEQRLVRYLSSRPLQRAQTQLKEKS